jgi:hypothetical protein
MDEHAKTELHLSEEQLQQITGGCDACDYNKRLMARHRLSAGRYNMLAEGAYERGDRQQSRTYARLAQITTRLAREHQAELDARQGTPGHPPAPGESPTEPPLKRQRLS